MTVKNMIVEDGAFPESGAAGLFTKADSVTLFNDFTYADKQGKTR